jgi:hypothetical protein
VIPFWERIVEIAPQPAAFARLPRVLTNMRPFEPNPGSRSWTYVRIRGILHASANAIISGKAVQG